MNKKGYINIILAVLIVVLVGTVGYLTFVKKPEPIIPTPKDETSSWKTYKSEDFNYELRYPSTWFLKDIIVDPQDETKLTDSIIMIDSKSITRGREANHLPSRGLQVIVHRSFNENASRCPSGNQLLGIDSIKISGVQYQRCKTEFGVVFYNIPIIHDSILYVFSYPVESEDTDIINRILSTFKFTEQKSRQKTAQPLIKVMSPDGGEIWKQGSRQIVRWKSYDLSPTSQIDITLRRQQPFTASQEDHALVIDTINDGLEEITLPDNLIGNLFWIEVGTSLGDNFINDWSDAPFSICDNTGRCLDL